MITKHGAIDEPDTCEIYKGKEQYPERYDRMCFHYDNMCYIFNSDEVWEVRLDKYTYTTNNKA